MDRPTRGERFQGLVETLLQLAYFHRAAAHVLAGWNPKIVDLDIKTETARHIFEDIDQTQRLNSHIFAITRGSGIKNLIPEGWRTLMRAIDAAPSADAMLLATYGVVKRHVHALYERTMAELDPILDGTLSYVLPPHLVLLSRQLAWGGGILPERMSPEAALFAARIEQLFGERHHGELITPERAIWDPIDRVPNAARPAGMPRGLPGSLRVLPLNSSTDPRGIGMFLHNLINGEYTTMELASRSLYEHPTMPSAFQLHMARQISDEARHARAIQALAAEYGVRYGDYQVYTLTYDGYYQFDACERGSRRELLWRLLIRGTIDEGLALDDFAFQVKRREHLGQERLADLFRYLLADEVFHAQSALKWSRFLAGDDEAKVLAEREAANAYVNQMVDARRREFVEAHPEAALAEVKHTREIVAEESKEPLPFDRTMNAAARKEAGFSERDLAQAIGWGYVQAPSAAHGRVIEHAVNERGITVEPAERESALRVIRADHRLGSDEALSSWLKEKGMTQKELDRHLDKIVAAGKVKASITEGRVEPYFLAHKSDFPRGLDDDARRAIQARLFQEWLTEQIASARIDLLLLEPS